MSFGIETQRAFVNTWECDENVHLNVQFYWKRFGDAGQIFAQLSRTSHQPWVDRHVRYYSELMMGTNTIVRTAAIKDASSIVHILSNGETDTLSSTAIDQYENPVLATKHIVDAIPLKAQPRSLSKNRLESINPTLVLENGLGLISHRSVISPMECDKHGNLLDQHHISRFSDAASHFWNHMGVNRTYINANDLGSVAVEMKVTRHLTAKVSMMVEIVTWLDNIQEKSFSFRHQVSDMSTGSVLYNGAVTALMIDLKTRKVVDLPDVVKQRR